MNHKDFAVTLITSAPDPQLSGTTLEVTVNHGVRLPIPPFYANAVPPGEMSTLDNTEKILVTDVTGDVLTIVRAQGETTAKLISVNWVLANCIYADDVDSKVDKVTGKGLSTEDYTTAEKSKLAGIADGAEVNVQPDWDQSDNTKDDYIKNKPTLLDEKVKISATDTTPGYLGSKIVSGNNTVVSKNNSPGDETLSIDVTTPFVGANILPTLTNNGDGSCTVSSGTYTFNNSTDGRGDFERFVVSGGTFTPTDGVLSYIVANYNSGSPLLQLITNSNLVNDHTVTPIFTLFREGTELHELDWDEQGSSQSDKLLRRLRRTERFVTEPGGLAISETATRVVNITSGVVWYGATSLGLSAFKSDVANNNLYRYIYNGSSWSKTIVTQYDNTYYQGPTGQVALTTNRYAVNWVYRGVEDDAHAYIVLGTGDYTLAQAELATIPALLPSIIPAHAILVGKIIVQKSATTATSILSAFTTPLTQSQTNDHNSLTNLQDAPNPVLGEHYHISSEQATAVSNLSGVNTGDQDLSGLVPYTGSTSAVDLGGFSLTADSVQSTTSGFSAFNSGGINFFSDAGVTNTGYINVLNPGQYTFKNNTAESIFDFNSATLNRTYTFPDNSGTIALTSDIVPDDNKLNIDQTTPQTTVGTFTFPQVATPILKPSTDSTSALGIFKANGTTNILSVDTTNSRIGINNTSPTVELDINGCGKISCSTYPVLDITRLSTLSNPAQISLRSSMKTTADMVDGAGTYIGFSIEDNTSGPQLIGAIGAIRNGADNSGDVTIQTYSAGVQGEVARFTSSKRLGLATSSPTHTLTLGYGGDGIALYNTGDQITNYERARMYWAGNSFYINTGNGGTGVRRDIYIGDGNDYYQYSRLVNTSYTHTFRAALSGATSTGGLRTIVIDTHSAGSAIGNHIYMGVTQSGTAGYHGLIINIAQNSVGSGEKNILTGTIDGTDKVKIDANGNFKTMAGVGQGFFLYGATNYGMTMGDTANYQYGGVFDYSVKFVMDGGATRGWTWGGYSTAPVMALTTGGNLQLAGTLTMPSTSTGQYFYNTTDQITNYERVRMYYSGNIFYFDSQNAGTGVNREVRFGLSGGIYKYGSDGNTYLQSYAGSGIARMNMFCGTISTSATGFAVGSTLSSSSNTTLAVSIQPTITQSGTAAYTALNINVTETSTGSGLKRLIDAKVDSSTKFYVSNTGYTAMPEIEITGDTGIHATATTSLIRMFGGNTAGNGAGIVMGGSANASISNTGILRSGSSDIMRWTTSLVTFVEGTNISIGATTGTKIGTSTNQKIGFYNATPIVQPSGTSADATDLATAITLVNNLKAKLISLGLIA